MTRPRAKATPIKWTPEAEVKLFLAILATSEVRVDNEVVAELLGGSASSISQHMVKLRNQAKSAFSVDSRAKASNETNISNGDKTAHGGNSGVKGINSEGGARSQDKTGGQASFRVPTNVTTPPKTPDTFGKDDCLGSDTPSRKGLGHTPNSKKRETIGGRIEKKGQSSSNKKKVAHLQMNAPLAQLGKIFDSGEGALINLAMIIGEGAQKESGNADEHVENEGQVMEMVA
ncbi:MAG: hypothetical protein M1837_003566 [Sclerophora amabilis]|nr:MAG: hypothetical protein M1837_003566 [Sclerophora amabilis]